MKLPLFIKRKEVPDRTVIPFGTNIDCPKCGLRFGRTMATIKLSSLPAIFHDQINKTEAGKILYSGNSLLIEPCPKCGLRTGEEIAMYYINKD